MQFDITEPATYIPIIAGVIIPFVVALLTKANASPNVKTLLAFLSAGLLALGTYLTDTTGAHTWKGAVSVFVVALVTAAASRVSLTEQWVAKVQAADGGLIGPRDTKSLHGPVQ